MSRERTALRWTATDPHGRRWELWAKTPQRWRYMGRVLVLERESIWHYFAGWFSGVDRTGKGRRWIEAEKLTLGSAAHAVVLQARDELDPKVKAPVSRSRNGG